MKITFKATVASIAEYGPRAKMWALGAHVGIEHCLYCGTKPPALDGTPS